DVATRGPVQQGVVGQLPVAGGRAVRSGNLTVVDLELVLGYSELVGGDPEVDVADLRTHLPKRRAGLLNGKAACGQALVWAQIGTGCRHLDAGDVDVEFLGGHLCQRGEHTLAQFDFPGTDFDDTV